MTLNCFAHKKLSHCIKMEFQKIINFLNIRFVTKKWIKVHYQSRKDNYNVNKEIRIKTPMLRSDLCDYSNAYIVVEGKITASFNST